MKFYTGLILILLGLFIKVYSADNSTQVYFVEIQIENGAYTNFSQLLQQLSILGNTGEASVTNFSITTECEGQKCWCKEGNSWSDRACTFSKCCKNDTCYTAKSFDMCLSDKRVDITGSFTKEDQIFTSYLEDPNSEQYQEYSKYFTEKMKDVYSTLNWFIGLSVTGFGQGSIIVEYSMLLAAPFQIKQLEDRAIKIQQNLNATNFKIVTTGYISISIEPKNELFKYTSNISIACSTPESIGDPVWLLDGKQEITNGNQATITNTQKSSNLLINYLSEVWNGTFTCDYKSSNSSSIIHRGSINVYVALLPEIITLSDPQFPDCSGSVKLLEINVFCIIPNTTEIYNITWSGESVVDNSKANLGNDLMVRYQAKTKVYCDTGTRFKSVYCQFQNRVGQTKTAAVNISIICKDTKLCYEENDWPNTPVNATAIKLCDFTSVGLQTRFCNVTTWANVTSQCVDKGLQNILDDAKNLQKGLGIVANNANTMFTRLKNSTENSTINTFANVNASVEVMENMNNASRIQNSSWNVTVLTDFLKSSSNLLNNSVIESWNNDVKLGIKYLSAVKDIIHISLNQSDTVPGYTKTQNVQLKICNKSSLSTAGCTFEPSFNVNISDIDTQGQVVQTAFKNLAQVFPDTLDKKQTIPSNIMVSVNSNLSGQIKMTFNFTRAPNHELHCVYLDESLQQWSTNGCRWIRDKTGAYCSCDHLSSFSVLMAKDPIELMYIDELTLTGLAVSIISLTISLVIEFLVWNTVVKSNISHFRHTVLVNIMLCLLVADASFVASQSKNIGNTNWCLILALMKHFCFLAAFFWMLCLSMGLLHQVIFVFVHLRKKVYLGLSFSVGYVCPFIIVIVTIVTYNNGAEGQYYTKETCWLTYDDVLKGSIHSFVLPIGVIVFVNIFSMVVVISRILKPTVSEGSTQDEKEVLRSIVKAVVFLTPTLGITWILGFCLFIFDLTNIPAAQIVNYAFIFFNSFQGFFILLTGCLGEKKVRDALLKRFRPQKSLHHKSESSTQSTSATKMK